MTKELYERAMSAVTKTPARKAAFGAVYKGLPAVMFAAYPLLLVYLFITRDARLIKVVLVPLFMFLTLSAARYFINAPRPYEVYDITPIYAKDTKGKSFPSRHTASAAVIAMAFLSVSPLLGAPFLLAALLIAASRVLGGVHFPKDVIAGVLYAVACGAALFLN